MRTSSEINKQETYLPIPLISLTEALLTQLLNYSDTELESETCRQLKEWLIGSKQSLLEAIIAISNLKMKQAELMHKLNQNQQEAPRNFNKEDISIIEQFLKEHAKINK